MLESRRAFGADGGGVEGREADGDSRGVGRVLQSDEREGVRDEEDAE